MMTWTGQWLLGVAGAAVVMALAEALTPEGGGKRVSRLAGGLLVLLATIGPLADWEEQDWEELLGLEEVSVEQVEEDLQEESDLLYESIIAQQAGAYIVDKAGEMGMKCEAQVEVRWEDAVPKLWSVQVTGQWTGEQQQSLSALVESELGIPAARQNFEEKRT